MRENGKKVRTASCDLALQLPEDATRRFTTTVRQVAKRMSSGTPFTITIAREAGIPVVFGDLPGETVASARSTTQGTNPPQRVPVRITIDPGKYGSLDRDHQVHAVMHEIGHLLGLDHSGIPSTLMYPHASGNTKLTAYERVSLAKTARGCTTSGDTTP